MNEKLSLEQQRYIVPKPVIIAIITEKITSHSSVTDNELCPGLIVHTIAYSNGLVAKMNVYKSLEGVYYPNFNITFCFGGEELQMLNFNDMEELALLSRVESGKYEGFVKFLREALSMCNFNPQ